MVRVYISLTSLRHKKEVRYIGYGGDTGGACNNRVMVPKALLFSGKGASKMLFPVEISDLDAEALVVVE